MLKRDDMRMKVKWLGSRYVRRFPLRDYRRGRWVPPIAGVLLVLVGILNVISAVTPTLSDRVHLLDVIEDKAAMVFAQDLALPFGLALILTAIYLVRRRQRALWLAVSLLLCMGVIDLFKGFDFEEALITLGLAGLLLLARPAFYVQSDRDRLPKTLSYGLGLAAASLIVAVAALVISVPWETEPLGGPVGTIRRALALLSLTTTPHGASGPVAWVPIALEVLGVLTFGLILARFFRRSPMPENPTDRNELVSVIKTHGSDTLSFFKLRADVHHLFTENRKAFLSYRVEGGKLMIAGDPVGETKLFPELIRSACSLAETRGLKVGVVGASKSLKELGKKAGLRSFYIGDEAIVSTGGFSLEGRKIKKVRQAVHRIERNGYRAELRRHGDLSRQERAQLEEVSSLWRHGESERGFSMTLDTMNGSHLDDCILVIARNQEDKIGGFLHFVPTYGRAAMSLSYMRRDPNTPNGMTDFLVVRAIQLLGEQGIAEISLNFAAFGRLFDGSAVGLRRVFSWVIGKFDRFFQVQSLYRFNRKFFPRWEPRYLLYEGVFGLPRTGIAALKVEGQFEPLKFRPLTRLGGG
jgi:lysyl-tRNA synthetase class 2